MTTIQLGFEVGSGAPVMIPLRNMVVTGQTQEAGKTTTMEAMIVRSGLRAITFVTKRGEKSFASGRRMAPYFRERADWVFVSSLIDATMREKNKILRAWLMKVCRNTRTLAEVQRNVREAQASARGFAESIYTEINGYLEIVVPQLSMLQPAKSLDISSRGLNVMDVSPFSVEVQALVIRSVMEHIYEHENHIITVIPEAWEFVPQGRSTPVTVAARELLRKGSTLGNYLWFDSQDLRGIDKEFVGQSPVILMGVQREANEIKRSLANLHGLKKPSVSEVASLGLGQFFACWRDGMFRTYVQPAWMSSADAKNVATGNRDIPKHNPPPHQPARLLKPTPPTEDDDMSKEDIERLSSDMRNLTSAVTALVDRQKRADDRKIPAPPPAAANHKTAAQISGSLDEEALYLRFKNRLLSELPTLANGATITVTPPEKLRKDFQIEESRRIVDSAASFRSLPARVLKLMETTDGDYVSQKTIAERLGRSTGGQSWMDLGKAIKELAAVGFVEVKERQGVRKTLRDRIANDLSFYAPTESDIDGVYNQVIFEIATVAGGAEA